MPKHDKFAATAELMHAAGLDEALWPDALASLSHLFGSVGTTLEVVDRTADGALADFWSHGVPPGSELTYAEHYLAVSPRMKLSHWHHPGDIGYDYLVIDEAGIDADAYYSDFLAPSDMRYFLSVTLVQNASQLACLAVQRSPREGHVDREDIATMRRLVPHLTAAFDLTQRLRAAAGFGKQLEHALDWLPDGVVLLRINGTVCYVNEAAQRYARQADGIRLLHDRLEFTESEARTKFDLAVAALRSGGAGEWDFHVRRPGDLPPYLVSVRPVVDRTGRLAGLPASAAIIVFIRDPAALAEISAGRISRELYGLTEAEAGLAEALARSISPSEYARLRQVSLNTVYTHLRNIKAKTGAKRLSELVTKLADLRAPLLGKEQRMRGTPGEEG